MRADSDNPERFSPGARFATTHPTYRSLVLDDARDGPHGLIASFVGVTIREVAQELVGHELMIRSTDRRELDHDEFWPDQLVGMRVRISGELIGTVDNVVLGPQDRLIVVTDDDRIAEIPFVEALVPEVDVASGVVEIDPPEGIFSPR